MNSFPMDDTTFQGYFIYRDDSDPTTLHFFPPKDSDDLFDALRAKFPHVKSHSERMRDAIIDFLMEERHADLIASTTSASPILPSDANSASPWQQSWPSMSTASSSFNSPDTLDISTPAYLGSPKPHVSNSGSQATPSSSLSTDQSPPQLEQMTGVFSLTSTAQPKQRVRRKMTEAEKVEYRKRRIVKACDKCQKRKRKCHHNQPEMETIPSKPNDKVTKPRAATASTRAVKTEQFEHLLGQDNTLDFDAPLDSDMQLFDDFTNILDDSLFQMPANAAPSVDYYLDLNNDNFDVQPNHNAGFDRTWQFRDRLQQAAVSPADQQHSSQSSAFGEPHRELPVPTHTAHAHDTEGSLAYVYDAPEGLGIAISPPNVPVMPWQNIPGQSLLDHAAAQNALDVVDRLLAMPRPSISLQPDALGQPSFALPPQPATLPSPALSREEWAMARDLCSYRSSVGGDASHALDSAWNFRHQACQSRASPEIADQLDSQSSGDRGSAQREKMPDTQADQARKPVLLDNASKKNETHRVGARSIDGSESHDKASSSDSKIPFGSGIDRAKSPSGELFMLRRRGLPPQVGRGVPSHVLATARAQRLAAPAAALGSVLQTIPANADLRQDGEIAQRNPVVHTRGRNPSAAASASPGDTDQRVVIAAGASPALSEERLTCHNRFRDHHGRASSTSSLLQAIPLVMAALLVAAVLPQATWLAFLAMCVPISGGVAQKRKGKSLESEPSLLSSLSRLVPCC